MHTYFEKLKLGAKVALLGAGGVLITSIALVTLAVWQSGQYNRLAQSEVDILINSDLDHITQGIYNLVQTENEAVQHQVNANLNVARHLLANAGGVSMSNDTVLWKATNQFSGSTASVQLPRMLVGNRWLGQNSDPASETAVVDEVTRLVGETATIFQRMNGVGDMLRVATTVKAGDGKRALGTYIPAVNPDGKPNPVIAAIRKGETYHGRAWVVNEWHLTAYEPIKDRAGKLVGMLYVGIRQKAVEERLRQAILKTGVGKTGYIYVLGGRGEDRGRYIISQRGERDGEDIWESRDSDGHSVIKAIIGKAISLKAGELATERYRWQNPGESAPRWKVARLAYFEPWDWVIATSVYEDELQTYRSVLSNGRIKMTNFMSIAGLTISFVIGLFGVFIAWAMIRPILQMQRAVETIVEGNLDQVIAIHSRDEIGALGEAFNHMTGRLKTTIGALKENAYFLQTLIDAIPNPIFFKDIHGVFQGCNAAFEKYLGQPKGGIVGLSVYDVAPKELADRYHEMDMELLRQGGVQVYESSVIYADGTLHDVIFNKATYSNEGGSLGGLVGVLLDITERKRAEMSVREVNERFRTVLRAATGYSIIGTDPDGIITVFNEGAELMLGYSAAEVIGTATPGLFHDLGEVAVRAAELGIKPGFEVFVSAPRQGKTEMREWTYIRKDGACLTVSLTVTAMRSEAGDLAGFIGIASDITEQKRADAELERYRDHLESIVKERTAQLEEAITNLSLARDAANQANQAKSTFLANMSHEIRTPMNAVLGFAQLLERDPSLSSQARNKVATIMKSGEHLLAIINDILEMSRIEAGRVELREETLDLHTLLDDLTDMFRLRAEEKGLTFTPNIAPDLPRYIVADLGKLRQILINLLGNAVKFTKLGSITLRALSAGLDRIAIEVVDTGIGITPEEQGKLFRPFERTRSGEQAAGGTGLGLAISREYAHLMAGDITVESQAGIGSCFRFECHAPAATKVPVTAKIQSHVTSLAPGQGEMRVLVVDDQATNRELLRLMLEPLGFIVDEASDGHEAIEKANCLMPRIILMDLVMPGMDGAEATRILRGINATESTVIIGITASVFDKEKQLFLDAGLDAYITKPFREQELYNLLACHAGVLFKTEVHELAVESPPVQTIPGLDKVSPEWREAFGQALARKNITRIRKLGEEAKKNDPVLSEWVLERAGVYDLDELMKLME